MHPNLVSPGKLHLVLHLSRYARGCTRHVHVRTQSSRACSRFGNICRATCMRMQASESELQLQRRRRNKAVPARCCCLHKHVLVWVGLEERVHNNNINRNNNKKRKEQEWAECVRERGVVELSIGYLSAPWSRSSPLSLFSSPSCSYSCSAVVVIKIVVVVVVVVVAAVVR